MDHRKLGERIKSLRESAGYSLEDLDHVSKVAKNTINQIEMGRGNPTLKTLEALAGGLGIQFTELFDLGNSGHLPAHALTAKGAMAGLKQARKHARAEKEKPYAGVNTGRKIKSAPASTRQPPMLEFPNAISLLTKFALLSPETQDLVLAIVFDEPERAAHLTADDLPKWLPQRPKAQLK